MLEFDRKAGGIDGRIDRSYFSDAVRAVAKRVAPGLFVMTREGVTALLSANGVKLEDCFSDCEVETGRKLGADYVVSGRLMKMGARFLLTMRLHKTQTAELLNTARAQGATIEELIDGTDAAAAELFRLDPAQAREQQASVPKPSRQDKGGARIPLPAKALAKDLRVAVASEGEGAARLADAAVRALAAAGLRPSIGHGPRDFDAKIAASADTTLSPPWTTIRQVAHVRLMDRAGVVLIAFELTAKASAGDAAEASRRGTADIAAQLESRLAGELRAIMRSH